MKDTGSELKTVRALSPQSDSGGSAVNGAVIDRKGYESAVMTVITGAIGGSPTSMSMAIKVQHGDASNLSDAADVSGATGTITAADSVKEIDVDLKSLKRYIRVTQTTTFVSGSSPTVLVGASCSMGEAQIKPAS